MPSHILITGATGNVGRATIDALAPVTVHAGVRNPEHASLP
ncbi:MAG: nucleoside-diphosphate sugar epimerase, partial [Chloroflexota bacterium]